MVREYTDGQLTILSIGSSLLYEPDTSRPGSQLKRDLEVRKVPEPDKPFKEMTGKEYMEYMDKGRVF